MSIKSISSELASQISNEEQQQVLKKHFALFYRVLFESQPIIKDKVWRSLSGIATPYHNAIFGCPDDRDTDAFINEQLHYFNETKMPFVWFLDKESNSEFKTKLLGLGFQDGGVFQGVIGKLNKPLSTPEIPDDCVLELIEDELAMDEFNELVCSTFSIPGSSKNLHKQILWNATKNPEHPMFHWIARKHGKVVSALSILIDGNVVSFWNGASLPEIRRQGLSTALRHLALKEAALKGCRIGISYLMSDGMALGICSKFGFQPKWRFNAFLSPNR